MDRYIGRVLDDRYEILEVIGTGGMAVVYKARCHRLNRLVAIKILKDENYQDADFRRRFHAEGQAVGMLSHPNIVGVYDVATCKAADYIVMELIDGISLKQYMEKKGVLNWKETLHFATQIAKALEHAHSKGLVHRDIKPHNVMVLKNGAVKVTDFGIACMTTKANTMTKEALGSVHYISPEQAKGGRVDCRSDLYSLGVVMYEMITGRPPFDGESPVAVALQHIAGGAANPSVLNPNIPAGLEQIIVKAMANDAKDRYPNAAAMLADLDAVRKDPAVVFSPEHLAPATKKAPKPAKEEKQEPQEKAPAKQPKAPKPAPVPKPEEKKQPKSREEKALTRDRVATMVIVLCALAIMAAVLIFLTTVLDDSGPQEAQKIQVPSVVGMHLDKVPTNYQVTIVRQSTAYSDEYDAGVIIRQLPEAGDWVEKDSKVFVVVSLGQKPEEVLMPDLADMSETEARMYLNGLNMGLKIERQEQSHETVAEGCVIRTTPEADTQLWPGATVTLYISAGKEIQTARMPNLLQGGASYLDAAKTQMELLGFTNVRWVPVDSTLPAGRIIGQSVPAGEMADLNALIVIEYASGKAPTVYAIMPDLLTGGGMHLDMAEMYMEMLGFKQVQWVEVDSSAAAGTVLSQSEAAGAQVDVNQQIVITYSNGMLVTYLIDGLESKDYVQYLTLTYTTESGGTEFIHLQLQPGQTSYAVELRKGQKYELYVDGQRVRAFTVPLEEQQPEMDQVEDGE